MQNFKWPFDMTLSALCSVSSGAFAIQKVEDRSKQILHGADFVKFLTNPLSLNKPKTT